MNDRYESPATRNDSVTSAAGSTRNWRSKWEVGRCGFCRVQFTEATSMGPARTYCSNACKQAAYRRRKIK